VIKNDKINKDLIEQEEQLQENLYNIGQYRIRSKRYIHKLKQRLEKYNPDESKMGKLFNLDKKESMKMITIASMPAIAALVPAAFGLLGVGISLLPIIGNVGVTLPSESQEIMNKIVGFAGKSAELTKESIIMATKASSLPFGLTLASLPKTYIEKRKTEKREEIEDEMAEIEGLIKLITDLKQNKTDISLTFIREFLSNVDITENSHDFNIGLLYAFVNYRENILQRQEKKISQRIVDESFMDIIRLLEYSSKTKSESTKFVNNQYVQTLINEFTIQEEKKSKYSKVKMKI
jgi:hypothetical protein